MLKSRYFINARFSEMAIGSRPQYLICSFSITNEVDKLNGSGVVPSFSNKYSLLRAIELSALELMWK